MIVDRCVSRNPMAVLVAGYLVGIGFVVNVYDMVICSYVMVEHGGGRVTIAVVLS